MTTSPGSGNDIISGGAGNDRASYFDDGFDGAGPITQGINANLATGTVVDGWGNTDTLTGIENINGTELVDQITGDALNNSLTGNGGNDFLFGGDGEDVLAGGDGNDTLDGQGNISGGQFDYADYRDATGAVTANLATGTASGLGVGTDTLISIEGIFGSAYDDSIVGAATDDLFFGNLGNDTIDGGAGFDIVGYNLVPVTTGVTVNLATGVVTGGAGNDQLSNIEGVLGTAFADVITGNAEGNFLRGNAGNDTIDGGAGSDRAAYDFASGGVTVNLVTGTSSGADGVDTLISIENLRGSSFADTLIGNSGNGFANDFQGEAGNDTMDGGAIADRINYTDLNTANYSRSPGAINLSLATGIAQDGYGGTDTLSNFNFVVGSNFNDTLTGSTALIFEHFEGGVGNDTIDGGAITDTLNFENSNRVSYQNAAAAVTVDLLAGTATGGAGNDTLLNINWARGSNFNDTLLGSDTTTVTELFEGRAGNDTIDGRGGSDVVRYENATSAVSVNLATGQANDGQGGTDSLLNIEAIRGSAFNDTLTGGNLANGSGASDGLEFFTGGAGNDTIDGGAGYDRADYTTSTAGVVVTLGGTSNGTASDGLGGTDTLISIEGVRGSAFNDTLTGSDSGVFESFEGREGNDSIDGNGGIDRADYQFAKAGVAVNLSTGAVDDGYGSSDTLFDIEDVRGSRDFNDTLTGNAADNKLEGLGGDDVLSGGLGNDTLIGGDGNDTLRYGGTATITGGAGIDRVVLSVAAIEAGNVAAVVTDFQAGTGGDHAGPGGRHYAPAGPRHGGQ